MMYISKGIICKKKNSNGLYIRHFGQPRELLGDEAVMWQKGRLGFAFAETQKEVAAVNGLVKKGIAVIECKWTDLDMYHALCRCAICANPKKKFGIFPFSESARRILIWLRKAGTNLTLPELVSLEEKRVIPTADLLYQENATKLLKIIHPWCVSMAGELEAKMRHSIVRKRTVDSVLELLRRKCVVLM